MNKSKKISLGIMGALVAATPIIIATSCGDNKKTDEVRKEFLIDNSITDPETYALFNKYFGQQEGDGVRDKDRVVKKDVILNLNGKKFELKKGDKWDNFKNMIKVYNDIVRQSTQKSKRNLLVKIKSSMSEQEASKEIAKYTNKELVPDKNLMITIEGLFVIRIKKDKDKVDMNLVKNLLKEAKRIESLPDEKQIMAYVKKYQDMWKDRSIIDLTF